MAYCDTTEPGSARVLEPLPARTILVDPCPTPAFCRMQNMPAKNKGARKLKRGDGTHENHLAAVQSAAVQPARSQSTPQPPTTVNERSQQRADQLRPYESARRKVGLNGLSAVEQAGWINAHFARSRHACGKLSSRAQRDLWKQVNETNLPIRTLDKQPYDWGSDRQGRDVGEHSVDQFEERIRKRVQLRALEVASSEFCRARERASIGLVDEHSQPEVVTETEVVAEGERRRRMADLKKELYGHETSRYALDPEWDDVVPIPQQEPEAALVTIAYPQEYAQAISYLRAVMVSKEYSPRCLRLTEHIISMNPAYYTVWLFRASVLFALQLPLRDELAWLNGVALANLKNYQIWHHRHLLVDHYYSEIASSPKAVAAFGTAERDFLQTILAEDSKNYHVWSYRSFLVAKLGRWGDREEMVATEGLIDDDVRNNSAWSHRFFLVFSDPAHATPGSAATAADPKVPAAILDRELTYAMNKTYLAPQNQSPWNYLRGVLVKGGRKLASVESFVGDFVTHVGDESEDVKSTHALDLLAEIYAEKGEKDKADLCLRRLTEKWDKIRAGYWAWRRKLIEVDMSDS